GFFFSSRRRHTRCLSDWSSDVCSSDLPRVMCYVGSKDGPAISGTAQIITDRSEVARVYRGYWKTHPLRMAIVIGLRLWIEMLLNKRVVVRVQPDEPNP